MDSLIDTAGSTSALLARFATGSLPAPANAFVKAHLELKSDRRRLVEDFEHMFGTTLSSMEPVEMQNKQSNLEAIFASDAAEISGASDLEPSDILTDNALTNSDNQIIPPALRDYIKMDVDNIPWKTKLPGFKEYEIGTVDGCEISMFWIKAGRAMPRHTHEGTELFMVLDGSFTDETGRYARGDISIADESVDHRPVAGKEGPCIGFSITDAPLKLTGSFYQRIGDLLG